MLSCGLWREDEGCREFETATRRSSLFEPDTSTEHTAGPGDKEGEKQNIMKVLNMEGAGGDKFLQGCLKTSLDVVLSVRANRPL